MKNIGIFSECAPPNVMNGVSVSIETFKKELEENGFHYFIFTTGYPNYHETDEHVVRLSILLPFEAKGGRYPIARPQSVNRIAQIVSADNIQLIHSQHLLSTGALGLKVAQKLHLPAVLTYHTLMTEYVHYVPLAGWLIKKWIIKKSRNYCNQYDTVITPSESMKKILLSYGVTVPIEVAPTGVDLADFQDPYTKAELKAKWHIPDEQDNIALFVGRMSKEKNVEFLLEAMRKLVLEKGRRDTHLIMVGPGPLMKKCQTLVKKWGIDQFVTFTGGLEKQETNKTFGGADLFVFASVTETQGLIINEAQAAGIPVLAVNIMGPSNSVHDGVDGILVPLNIDEFTDKMDYLLKNENIRREMSKKAQEAAKLVSSVACGQKLGKLYGSLIEQHHYRP